jgi:hypothetical protein
MDAIYFWICRCFWGFVFLIASMLPLFVLFHLFEDNETFKSLRPVFAVYFIAGVLGSGWLAHRMSHHLSFENRNLYNAFWFTVWDARMHLGFLPVVGKWLMPRKPERHEDHDDDSDR